MSSNKVVILTGATGGLGKAMAEEIAGRPEAITLLATSRRGTDLGLKPANPQSKIVYPKLDLVQPGSIEALLKLVKEEYGGKVDALLLNAGAHFDEVDNSTFGKDLAKQTMDLNYYGQLKMFETFSPLMPAGGRVVNVTSSLAWLVTSENPLMRGRKATDKFELHELNESAEEYIEAAALGLDKGDKHLRQVMNPTYSTAKALLSLLTAWQARQRPDLLVNSACPGVCDTEEAAKANVHALGLKAKTAKQGARVPLRLAFDDDFNGASGKFFAGVTSADTGPGEIFEDWPGHPISFDKV